MKIVIWLSTAETNFLDILIYTAELLAAKSITVRSACILVWLMCTLLRGMGTHMTEWILSLWRSKWHCTLLLMDPCLISIDLIAKSMIDTKYKQELLKCSFYFCAGGEHDTETVCLTCMLIDFCDLHLHFHSSFLSLGC